MIRIYKNLSTIFYFLVNKIRLRQQNIHPLILFLASELFKSHCLLCSESTQVNKQLCVGCIEDLPKISGHCHICYLPMPLEQKDHFNANELVCGECISKPPSFTCTIGAFQYDFPVREIIRNIKYSNQRYWIKPLCLILIEELQKTLPGQKHLTHSDGRHPDHAYPDLLIPVPLHKSKRRQRGFNQAELMGNIISKYMHIPLDKNLLIKTHATETQARLNKQERMDNLKNSMHIRHQAIANKALEGKHIALIDDVMTTKATAEYASQLLICAGARRVDIWCLARTPKNSAKT